MTTVSATAGFLLGAAVLLVLSPVALRHSTADARPDRFSSNVVDQEVPPEGSLQGRHQVEPVRAAVSSSTTAPAATVEFGEVPRGRKMAGGEKVGGNAVAKVKRDHHHHHGATKVKSEKNDAVAPAAGARGVSTTASSCAGDGEAVGELDVECELSGGGTLPSGDVGFVDFIPFSSDYRGAKTHPPKNN